MAWSSEKLYLGSNLVSTNYVCPWTTYWSFPGFISSSMRGFGWAINESVLMTHLRKHLSRILNPTPLVCHLLAVFRSWRIWFFVLFPPDIIPVSPSTSLVSKLPFTRKVRSPRTSAVVSFQISLCPYMCQTRCWMPSLSFWSCFYCSQFVFVSFIWLCFWSVANSGMQVGRARS